MEIVKIKKEYDKFCLPEDNIPKYEESPNEFALKYKRCSLLKYNIVFYSNNTQDSTDPKNLKTDNCIKSE